MLKSVCLLMAGHTVCVRALCFAGGRQRGVMHEQTHVYTAVCVCVCYV